MFLLNPLSFALTYDLPFLITSLLWQCGHCTGSQTAIMLNQQLTLTSFSARYYK